MALIANHNRITGALPTPAAVQRRHRLALACVAALLLGASWPQLWTGTGFWNPLFFVGTWLGATLLMYSAGKQGYPGWRRHAILALVSIPVWWWFELVNARVDSWEYVQTQDYDRLQYLLLASLAFSTVVPALDSACGVTLERLRTSVEGAQPRVPVLYPVEVTAGLGTVALVYAYPDLFFPLVWVSPFLIVDGIVGYRGGRNFVLEMRRGRWRLILGVALAGLWCGLLWEFWNYWSDPKWVYDVPYLDYLDLFEMPILGYLGYVPFAWSVYQILHLLPQHRKHREGVAIAGLALKG